MQNFRLLPLLLAICLLLTGGPLSAFAAETVFSTKYIGSSFEEVVKIEGAPDDVLKTDDQETSLIYRHKMLDGRKFTVTYGVEAGIIDEVSYIDNEPETTSILNPEAEWTWLADMGKTETEIIGRWGQPQNYYFAEENVPFGRLDKAHTISYYNVSLNGYIYKIAYHFHSAKVVGVSGIGIIVLPHNKLMDYFNAAKTNLTAMFNDPAWTYRISSSTKTHMYFLADEQYLATVEAGPIPFRSSMSLSFSLWSYDTGNAMIDDNYLFLCRMLISNWERDDTNKGGNIDEIIEMGEKLDTKLSQINASLEE